MSGAESLLQRHENTPLLLTCTPLAPPCPRSERVPRFAWALVLLLLLEGVMLWRYQPWAVPIEVVPPPPGRVA